MTADPGRDARLDALQQALALYAQHVGATPTQVGELLAAHPDLAPLLEPMFAAAEESGDVDAPQGIGPYRLLREIGRGGMGIVYEAEDPALQRRVALKLLAAERVADPDAVARFRREAAAAAGLDHPGIVKVYANGNLDGCEFIAMELVRGVPLSEVLAALSGGAAPQTDDRCLLEALQQNLADPSKEGVRPGQGSYVGRIVGLMLEVARALAHAHERGLVHRDVKPANILLRADFSAVLTDFGISRRGDQPSLTRTGEAPGTPYYMAPEQVRGEAEAGDPRGDVFALGVTMYEALTQQRPFEGRTGAQVLQQILNAEPVPPRQLNPNLPADLAAVLLRALEKDPQRRYPSAQAFAEDLEAFLAYRPVRARAPGLGLRLRRWAQREPLRAGALLLGLLAVPSLAGGLGYWAAIQPTLRAGESVLAESQIESLLTRGFLAIEMQDTAGAAAAFHEVLEYEPERPEAVAGLVLIHGPTRGAQAWKQFHELVREPVQSMPLRRLRATLSDWRGAFEEAARLREGLGPVQGHLDAFVAGITEIGRGHRGRPGAMKAALRYLDLCVLTAPRPRPVYHFERAHALGHLNLAQQGASAAAAMDQLWPKMPEARFWSAFALGVTAPKQAIAQLRRAMQGEESRWLFWNNLGYYLQADGQLQAAKQAYQRTLQIRPGYAEAWFDLAVVLSRMGQRDAALKAYRRATKAAPRMLRAWLHLADELLEAESWELAKQAIDAAMKIAPRSAIAQRAMGEYLIHAGRLDDALRYLRRAQNIGPTSRGAFHLGRALTRKGQVHAAIVAYRTATRIEPSNGQAYNNLGNLFKRRGEVAAAETEFRAALRVQPQLSQAYRNLWGVLNSQGRRKDLLALCADWRDKMPEDPHAWGKSAYAILWVGPGDAAARAKAALSIARRARELSVDRLPVVAHDVAWVLHRNGERKLAREILGQALTQAKKLGPGYRGVVKTLQASLRQLPLEGPR